jgi:HD superfamily phosphodiesterase
MMKPTTRQIEQIKLFAGAKYDGLHHTHGANHAQRTVKLAAYIAQQETANQTICELGALLHQYHPEGVSEVREFLESIEVEEPLQSQLIECVECSEPDAISDGCSLEAKVVFDADKLQTLGPFGLLREVVYRVETLKLSFMDAYFQSKLLQLEMREKLQTKTGNQMASDSCRDMNAIYKSIEKWDSLEFIG